jgi:RNA polymerase sigma factor (sigma-70 family)
MEIPMQDHELLGSFANDASQEAFAEIVRRHADTVYSAARQQMRNEQLADDVTQAVFIILAQKARKIDHSTPLPGWLLKTTYFACQDARRQMARRRRHELAAAAMEQTMTTTQPFHHAQLEEVSNELDAALLTLSDRDRGAVTLRFLNGKSINETAESLGISPAAATKRIGRAIERSVMFGEPVDVHGNTQIAIGCSGLGNDTDIRVVAIDLSKKVHPCKTLHLLTNSTLAMGEFSSDLPEALIKEWQLQTRPFDQWIEIRHVALHAGQNTHVEIVTSDDPAKP